MRCWRADHGFGWLYVIALVLGAGALAACESEQQVGSECAGGVCPAQESLAAPPCLLGNTVSEVAIPGLLPSETEAPWICLPRPIPRGEDGLVSCKLVLSLPSAAEAGADDPTDCGDLGYAESTGTTDDLGRTQCVLDQLPVVDGEVGGDGADGWYYDDFSEGVQRACPEGAKQRITATEQPSGGSLRLDCLTALASRRDVAPSLAIDGDTVPVAPQMCAPLKPTEEPDVGAACLPGVSPEGGFDDREAYVEVGAPDCESRACLVFRVRGDISADCDASDPDALCTPPQQVEDRVYCSCRCSAAQGEEVDPAELCDCPDGFSCLDTLPLGPNGSEGGYCVRNGTFSQ